MAFSEKEEQLRQILAKLDAVENDAGVSTLTADDITQVRRHLAEGQSLVRDSVDRLRQKQEEVDMVTRRKDELEARLTALEAEYEELLGWSASHLGVRKADCHVEKTIHEEETSNVDIAESMAELKARSTLLAGRSSLTFFSEQIGGAIRGETRDSSQ